MSVSVMTAAASVLLCLCASISLAEPCSVRPSDAISGFGTGAVATAGTAVAASGTAMKAAGFYTFVHASTGSAMLATTAGGISAAGTVGIMGGTSGVVGTAASVLMAPVTIAVGAAVAVGTLGWEGVCYFKDERITDYALVLERMLEISRSADPSQFQVAFPDGANGAWIFVRNSDASFDTYSVANLYIVNGTLMHRDWFQNTTLGYVAFFVPETEPRK